VVLLEEEVAAGNIENARRGRLLNADWRRGFCLCLFLGGEKEPALPAVAAEEVVLLLVLLFPPSCRSAWGCEIRRKNLEPHVWWLAATAAAMSVAVRERESRRAIVCAVWRCWSCSGVLEGDCAAFVLWMLLWW